MYMYCSPNIESLGVDVEFCKGVAKLDKSLSNSPDLIYCGMLRALRAPLPLNLPLDVQKH